MTRRIIRTDGTTQELPEPLPVAKLLERIGAGTGDTVCLPHMGEPLHVMLVDDNGYEIKVIEKENATHLVPTKARKPVNAEATRLYHLNCRPGTTHQIVGDVAIVPDDDFGDD